MGFSDQQSRISHLWSLQLTVNLLGPESWRRASFRFEKQFPAGAHRRRWAGLHMERFCLHVSVCSHLDFRPLHASFLPSRGSTYKTLLPGSSLLYPLRTLRLDGGASSLLLFLSPAVWLEGKSRLRELEEWAGHWGAVQGAYLE